MSKRRSDDNLSQQLKASRRAARAEQVDALRDGRKLRAQTYADRRKVASKRACRQRRYWD